MLREKILVRKKVSIFVIDVVSLLTQILKKRYKIGIDTPKDNTSGMKIIRRYDLCKHCTSVIINYVEKKGK